MTKRDEIAEMRFSLRHLESQAGEIQKKLWKIRERIENVRKLIDLLEADEKAA